MTNELAADLALLDAVAQGTGETTGTDIQPEASAVVYSSGLSSQQFTAYRDFMTTLEDMDR
jgi:hypothetical protein